MESDPHGEAADWPDDPAADDPAAVAEMLAHFERIVGPEGLNAGEPGFRWLLPLAGMEEFLRLLRGAPSGVGVAGLEAYVRGRLGTLSGLKAVGDERDPGDST